MRLTLIATAHDGDGFKGLRETRLDFFPVESCKQLHFNNVAVQVVTIPQAYEEAA